MMYTYERLSMKLSILIIKKMCHIKITVVTLSFISNEIDLLRNI